MFAYSFEYAESKSILQKAVQQVLIDKGFDLSSVPAQNAKNQQKSSQNGAMI